MRSVVSRFVPPAIRARVARKRQIAANAGGDLFCPVCRHTIVSFLPHGIPPRAGILCPICRSKACHRLAWAWFVQNPEVFQSGRLIIHVAPEVELGSWMHRRCAQSGSRYISGDIRDPTDPIDVLAMKFASDSVDLLFACHVLNMVTNDDTAMREIFRVIRPGGIAVLPVPIHSDVHSTIEADGDSNQSERITLFGDAHMYRKYTSQEYQQRLEAVGFQVNHFRPTDVADQDAGKWMLCDEWVQVATKPMPRDIHSEND